jgi:FKBP-type peptidyl-prolyl cis-trans isomerase FkpA
MQLLTNPMRVAAIVLSGLVIVLVSCGQSEISDKKSDPEKISESLLKANKKLVKNENEQITDFIARYGWNMTETGSGLRYMVYEHGSGNLAVKGDTVSLKYSVSFLNGDICYSSEEIGNKVFIVGQGGVETGLEEGILFLKKGDRAKFILPSHLAFGLVGDGSKIPAKATLVYDIELLDLK